MEIPGLKLTTQRPMDSKLLVQESPRPLGTNVYFTSEGDSTSSPLSIGGGENFCIAHNIGDSTVQVKYVDFNVSENPTYVSGGAVQYTDASMVDVKFCVVPGVTPFVPGSGTSYNSYGPIVIPAAPGTGTIDIATQDIRLLQVPKGVDYNDSKPAYWDADYNAITHQYENIRPNYLGTGQFNIFIAEVSLGQFVNVRLLGHGVYVFSSKDITQLGYGMRFRLTATTFQDHNWALSGILNLFRLRF